MSEKEMKWKQFLEEKTTPYTEVYNKYPNPKSVTNYSLIETNAKTSFDFRMFCIGLKYGQEIDLKDYIPVADVTDRIAELEKKLEEISETENEVVCAGVFGAITELSRLLPKEGEK